MYFYQRHLLYFPTPAVEDVSLQSIHFSVAEQTLEGWVINPRQAQGLIYFGGNAEQITHNIRLFTQKMPHYTVYLVNYRGYGRSTGEPSEAALFADALFIYDQVKTKHQTLINQHFDRLFY